MPEAPAAAPPAAPSPAPIAPGPTAAPPTPGPGAAPAPPSGDTGPMLEAFGAMEGYMEDAPGAAPEPAKGTPEPSKEPAKAPEKPAAKAPDKPAELPKKPEEPPIEKMAPKQLRDAYSRLRSQVKDLESKLKAEAEKAAKQPPADDGEKKRLTETLAEREKRLTDLEKRSKDLEQEREFSDFERSETYKKQYWDPYVEAFNDGRELVKQFTVTEGETERPGKAEDFDALMQIANPSQAAQFAADKFGIGQTEVMAARREIINRNRQRLKALDDFKAAGDQRQQQMQATMEELNRTFKATTEAAVAKYPHWFKPTEGEAMDAKANELLEKGMKFADELLFQNKANPQETAKRMSVIRNKAGAFDRVAYELKKANSRIAELQSKLDEIESSAPGAGTSRRAGAEKPSDTDWESQLASLATPG